MYFSASFIGLIAELHYDPAFCHSFLFVPVCDGIYASYYFPSLLIAHDCARLMEFRWHDGKTGGL